MALAREMMQGGISAGTAQALGGQSNTALAAAGSSQATATLIQTSNCIVTGADGTKAVVLPACNSGDEVWVINNSASSLIVYPPSGAGIVATGSGLGTVNASYAQTTYTTCMYKCFSSTQWGVIKT